VGAGWQEGMGSWYEGCAVDEKASKQGSIDRKKAGLQEHLPATNNSTLSSSQPPDPSPTAVLPLPPPSNFSAPPPPSAPPRTPAGPREHPLCCQADGGCGSVPRPDLPHHLGGGARPGTGRGGLQHGESAGGGGVRGARGGWGAGRGGAEEAQNFGRDDGSTPRVGGGGYILLLGCKAMTWDCPLH
jgi:hypothetical protein